VVEWVVEGLGRRAMNQVMKDGVIKTAAGRRKAGNNERYRGEALWTRRLAPDS
jgi:hypothetical protein